MKKSCNHVLISWTLIASLTFYSIALSIPAHAQEVTEAPGKISVPLPSCDVLGIPTLNLTMPTLGSEGSVYDIGSRYKIFDTTANKQLVVEGTFLTRPAAASLLVNLQNIESTWRVELNRVLSYNNSCWDYRLSLAESEIKLRDSKIVAMDSEMKERLRIRDEQIQFLQKNLKPAPWYESGEFWFAVGLVSGVGVTAVAGYALGQVSK